MTPEDFPAFFSAVHGDGRPDFKPFPWQVRLARQVATTGWVTRLQLPTGSGKSAVIDIAVFALACQADRPAMERVPLRTFFVVDRRVVVQQAALSAQKLAHALATARDGILGEAAQRLRTLGGAVPLEVREMRGGMYASSRGVDRLDQPLVTVTTVDQVGSRLLFRGYGVSPEMRPVHAAATCLDTLYLLDEAQLSWAFAQTLGSVARYAGWAQHTLLPPPRLVTLSATLPSGSGEEPFRLDGTDLQDPELGRRLRAGKRATLHKVGKEDPGGSEQPLEAEAVHLAKGFAAPGSVVGVVVSRVAAARRIFEDLRAAGEHSILLTGRIRPYDRDVLLERYRTRLFAEDRDRASSDCLFVVATQTVEVGADFDWDAMVTDLAPLPAMFQRFGRLNRRGLLEEALAAIIRAKEPGVYAPEDLEVSWEWLRKHAEGKGKKATVNMSPLRLEELRMAGDVPSHELPPSPAIPPRYLELWAHTSPPSPHPDPDVAPYLHGDAPGSADVSIVWRADLTEEELRHARHAQEWLAYCATKVALAPPRSAEALSVPVWEARAWLAEAQTSLPLADIEGMGEDSDQEPQGHRGTDRLALSWRGKDESTVRTAAEIRPGDVLVVPVSYGGADEFGWNRAASQPVMDIADAVASGTGRRQVRLHPGLLSQLLGGASPAGLRVGLREVLAAHDEVPLRQWRAMLDAYLADLDGSTDATVRDARGDLGGGEPKVVPYPIAPGASAPEGLLLRYPSTGTTDARRSGGESDADVSDATGVVTTLRRHTWDVLRWTRRFAQAACLPESLVHDMRLAALLHDIGKAEPRFQAMLHGGDELGSALSTRPLAKSGMDPHDHARMDAAWRASGLPRGLRHEFISAGMVSLGSGALGSAHDPDLVLHLIGTHHGLGRPFPPLSDDRAPTRVTVRFGSTLLHGSSTHGLERLGSGWVERFWRLNRRYGFWGLALLESLLRTADWQASREEGGGW